MQKIIRTEEEWREQLTPEQYETCREKGTELPFSSEFNEFYGDGIYRCICCDAQLFSTVQQFNSGCGWPSYSAPINDAAVILREDTPLEDEIKRIEVVCAQCDAHLGHVFIDDPENPKDLRFCINGTALWFEEER